MEVRFIADLAENGTDVTQQIIRIQTNASGNPNKNKPCRNILLSGPKLITGGQQPYLHFRGQSFGAGTVVKKVG